MDTITVYEAISSPTAFQFTNAHFRAIDQPTSTVDQDDRRRRAIPSLALAAGDQAVFNLRIKWNKNSNDQNPIIVRAWTQVEGDKESSRFTLLPQLPSKQGIALSVKPPSNLLHTREDGLTILPWPNQVTAFDLGLVNRSNLLKTVSVDVLVPQRQLPPISNYVISAKEAEELREITQAKTLQSIPTVDLPPNGDFVPIPFLATPETPADTLTAEPDAEKSSARPSLSKLQPQREAIPHGLILMIKNLDSKGVTVKPIQFLTQRPRKFIRPTVSYNAVEERLKVVVKAVDPNNMPPKPVQILGRLPSFDIESLDAKLEGTLSPPSWETHLSVNLPKSSEPQPFYLDIEGYPRAFIYEIKAIRTVRNIAETNDRIRIRIVEPLSQTVFSDETTEVPIKIHADGPIGGFTSIDDGLIYGFDINQDRIFRDEATFGQQSDRNVMCYLDSLGPSGKARISSEVGDLELNLPSSNLPNGRANLLAKLSFNQTNQWSEPVEIIMDRQAPKIQSVQVQSAENIILINSSTTISAVASDGDLSGVEEVKIGLEAVDGDKFATSPPAITASRIGDSMRWQGVLETAAARPGPTNILVQAIDRASLQSDFFKVPVVVATPLQAVERIRAKTIDLFGQVMFSDQVAVNVTLELEFLGDLDTAPHLEAGELADPVVPPTSSDQNGRFTLKSVPQGNYRLKAKGVVKNRTRQAQIDLKVTANEKMTQTIDPLELETIRP